MGEENEQLSKEEILNRIVHERKLLENVLEELETSQMSLPGVEGEWSVKDILAHLNTWVWRMVGWAKEAQDGETPMMPARGMTWDDLDLLNDQTYQANRDRPLNEVLAEFHLAHEEALRLVNSISEEDLTDPQRFPWRNGRPLWNMVAANTWWHDREHREAIERWLRNR